MAKALSVYGNLRIGLRGKGFKSFQLVHKPGIVSINHYSPTEQESHRTISLHEVVEKSSLHTTQTISAVVSFTRKQLNRR